MERQHIEIYRHDGSGFKAQFSFEGWRVGLLCADTRFIDISYLERHLLTDEAFALLSGKAALITHGAAYEYTVMQSGVVYNIPKGLLHNILVSDDATVIIMENADTGKHNSEYEDFNAADIPADVMRAVRNI